MIFQKNNILQALGVSNVIYVNQEGIIIKEFTTVTQTIEIRKLAKCTCDRCGKEVQLGDAWDDIDNKYSSIEIVNHFVSDISSSRRKYFEVCPDCLLELLEFFTQVKNLEEFKDDILFWNEDQLHITSIMCIRDDYE